MEDKIITALNTNYLSFKASGNSWYIIWDRFGGEPVRMQGSSRDDVVKRLYDKIKDELQFL